MLVILSIVMQPNGLRHLTAGFERIDDALLSIEKSFSSEPSDPTEHADLINGEALRQEIDLLLDLASRQNMQSYEPFEQASWPDGIRELTPLDVTYFNATASPDANGIFLVMEKRQAWVAGVLICRQRKPEWQGQFLDGRVVHAGPDFGFKRLSKDAHFWHWIREGSTIQKEP